MVKTTVPGRMITKGDACPARLVIYEPERPARVVQVNRSSMTIGRSESAAISLADNRVSTQHARLRRRRDTKRLEIIDEGSTNGTYVDGELVPSAIPEAFSVFRFGDSIVLFEEALHTTDVLDPRQSLAWVTLMREARHAAILETPILLNGPTGAGKGYLAERIAENSGRSGPLIKVNCAAMPADLVESELFGHVKGAFTGANADKLGLFQAAQGGTIFLDEIGAVPAEFQAKLLTCIEERVVRRVGDTRSTSIDVRIIAATNIDVPKAVSNGSFRRDLYYRLSSIRLDVAPLTRRRVDIIPILTSAIGRSDHRAFSAEALEALLLYEWPGNVRELLNLAQTLPTDADRIDYHALPAEMTEFIRARAKVRDRSNQDVMPRRKTLIEGLVETDGNVSELARRLGCHRTQLARWLKGYGIQTNRPKS